MHSPIWASRPGVRPAIEVDGMSNEESRALLDELEAHVLQPRFRYDHQHVPGDVTLWDNYLTLHNTPLLKRNMRLDRRRAPALPPELQGRTGAHPAAQRPAGMACRAHQRRLCNAGRDYRGDLSQGTGRYGRRGAAGAAGRGLAGHAAPSYNGRLTTSPDKGGYMRILSLMCAALVGVPFALFDPCRGALRLLAAATTASVVAGISMVNPPCSL